MNANGFIASAAFVLLLSAIVSQGDVASDDLPSPPKKPVRNGLNPLLVKKVRIGPTIRPDNYKPSNEDAAPESPRQRLNKKVGATTTETSREIFEGPIQNRRVQRGARLSNSSAPNNKTKAGNAKLLGNGWKSLESGEQRKPINDNKPALPIRKTASVTSPQSDVLVVPQSDVVRPTVGIMAANKENLKSNTEIGSNEKYRDESIQYRNKEVSGSNMKTNGSKKPVYLKKLLTKSSKIVDRPEDQSIGLRMNQGDDADIDDECLSEHVTTKKDLTSATNKSTKKIQNELNLSQRMKPVENQKPNKNPEKRPFNVKASGSSVDIAKPDDTPVEAIVLEFPYAKNYEANDRPK